jgi:hypothetical protein
MAFGIIFTRPIDFWTVWSAGFVRRLIVAACIIIIYIIFYISYFLWKIINYLMWGGKMNAVTKPFWIVFDKITLYAFVLCLMILPVIIVFFLLLYFIWKAFWFFIRNTSPFSDCDQLGVFRLIERIFEISGSDISSNEKAEENIQEILIFLQTFFEETFGIIFEGYQFNSAYLSAALKYYITDKLFPDDKEKCNQLKDELSNFVKNAFPVVRITYDEDVPSAKPPANVKEIKNIDDCISTYTKHVPEDAGTIEKLKLIFINEIAKKKCQFTFANACPSKDDNSVDPKCVLGEMERGIKSLTDDFGASLITGIGNNTSNFSARFTTEQANIDSQIKK